jgi:hypothetical protein
MEVVRRGDQNGWCLIRSECPEFRHLLINVALGLSAA